MNVKEYVEDISLPLLIQCLLAGLMFLFMRAFSVDTELLVCILIIYGLGSCFIWGYEYHRKKGFYRMLFDHIDRLDQKNLLPETLEEASFYEGRMLLEILYRMGGSMTEQIRREREVTCDFKEFIELWVHEMKLPLSSMTLQLHNDGKVDEASLREADEIVDQILYYTRSETPEKDFLIKEVSLRKLVSEIAQKYRKDLQAADISLEVNVLEETVLSDGKWLGFCLGQFLNNAIKYRKENAPDAKICITAEKQNEEVVLSVYDNGIGIPAEDLMHVTKKSFTGVNGHRTKKSTGMGLYIVSNLCKKLGHRLEIESERGDYTRVSIAFSKDKNYEFIRE